MTSFWEVPSSTTGMRTGPRAGCSSGFLRRGSTYVVSVFERERERDGWVCLSLFHSFVCSVLLYEDNNFSGSMII